MKNGEYQSDSMSGVVISKYFKGHIWPNKRQRILTFNKYCTRVYAKDYLISRIGSHSKTETSEKG